jgi:hypothetical protein
MAVIFGKMVDPRPWMGGAGVAAGLLMESIRPEVGFADE